MREGDGEGGREREREEPTVAFTSELIHSYSIAHNDFHGNTGSLTHMPLTQSTLTLSHTPSTSCTVLYTIVESLLSH